MKQTLEVVKLIQRMVVNWVASPSFRPRIQEVIPSGSQELNSFDDEPSQCKKPITNNMSLKRNTSKTSKNLGANLQTENLIYGDFHGETFPSQHRSEDFRTNQKPVIKIFVVYERCLNLERVREVQADLNRCLGRSFSFSVSSWKLQSLWHPKMLDMATDAIAQADIILFSLVSGIEPSEFIKRWLEKCLIHGAIHEVSLLALLETGSLGMPRSSLPERYVRNLAADAGADCLCYSDGTPVPKPVRHYEWDNDKDSAHYQRANLLRPENKRRSLAFTE